jgi:hypothetical protein
VEEVVWLSESKVFVHSLIGIHGPVGERAVPQESLERLAELLRGEGLDAQYGDPSEVRHPTSQEVGEAFSVLQLAETVYIWFAQGAVWALGGAAALAAVKWLKERFLEKQDEGRVVRTVLLIEDSGVEEGVVRQIVRLGGADSEPVVLTDPKYGIDPKIPVTVEKSNETRRALSAEDDYSGMQ